MTEIPDAALRARQMYADGATLRDIAAATGLSRAALDRWFDGGDGQLPPLPRRRIGGRDDSAGKAGGRATLIRRIMRAAEMQVAQIGKRLAEDGVTLGERERQTRSLAVLAKTMRELTALEAAGAEAQPAKTEANDDELPRDIDELRRELARRVEGIRQRRRAAGTAGGV